MEYCVSNADDQKFIETMERIQYLTSGTSGRDLEVANNIFRWLHSNGVTAVQVFEYMELMFTVSKMKLLGYFTPVETREQGKRIHEIEKTVPSKRILHFAKQMRWAAMETSQNSRARQGG
jgi:hypothetical protein